jgi:hypothetical protein
MTAAAHQLVTPLSVASLTEISLRVVHATIHYRREIGCGKLGVWTETPSPM